MKTTYNIGVGDRVQIWPAGDDAPHYVTVIEITDAEVILADGSVWSRYDNDGQPVAWQVTG